MPLDPSDPKVNEEWRIEDIMANREIAVEQMHELASRGHDLAGMCVELELAASPFYLGLEADDDDSDLMVYP